MLLRFALRSRYARRIGTPDAFRLRLNDQRRNGGTRPVDSSRSWTIFGAPPVVTGFEL